MTILRKPLGNPHPPAYAGPSLSPRERETEGEGLTPRTHPCDTPS